jgi:hypothetical protein
MNAPVKHSQQPLAKSSPVLATLTGRHVHEAGSPRADLDSCRTSYCAQ